MKLAEFRDSVYEKGFGFDVEVFESEKHGVEVSSQKLLKSHYDNFEEFLDDLIKKNPLWFTYYFVRIDPKYTELIKEKLSESYRDTFGWLAKSVFLTPQQWGLGDFAQKSMLEAFNNRNFELNFLTKK
jgi:hypothetical protein